MPLKVGLACVAGVRKERGRELGRETTREGGGASSRALSRFSRAYNSLSHPFQKPATQAKAGPEPGPH